jgi:DNA-damage-inducible protein J
MARIAVVKVQIDEDVKDAAAKVLMSMGITVSGAFCMLMEKIAADKTLPFEPLPPRPPAVDSTKAPRREQPDRDARIINDPGPRRRR